MAALQLHREAWRNAKARRLKAEQDEEELRLMMIEEERKLARERGQMADHYVKSDRVDKIESVSETAAEIIDTVAGSAAEAVKSVKKKKPKVEVFAIETGTQRVEKTTTTRIKEPEQKKKPWYSRAWGAVCRAAKAVWRVIKTVVKVLFVFTVEMLVRTDGKWETWFATGKAAKKLYDKHRYALAV